VPARFEKVFFDWMEKIHDWNVSRQLWWGHRIPAWYCPDGHVTVSDKPDGPDACAHCKRPAGELRQDEDIFDTWFSSGLWPFSTLGWPDATPDFRRYYPGTVMETGYDIIFFWVARMMMLGEWLTGFAPFRDVYLHGMIRDPEGKKMSKTRGNVIDPLGVLDDLGADVLRFALVHGSAPGADQRLGPTRLEGARNFANKLWNAARFVLGARPAELPAHDLLGLPPKRHMGPAEHWIVWRCRRTIADVERAYSAFQFGEATRLLHDAIWSEYCDWYLELAKVQLAPDSPVERRTATWQVLSWVLDRYLRLLHPVMPFITESIWDRLPHLEGDTAMLVVAPWPSVTDAADVADADQAASVEDALELVRAVRNARAEAGIEAGTWLAASVVLTDARLTATFPALQEAVERLGRIRISLEEDRRSLDTVAGASTVPVVTRAAEARLARAGADPARDCARLERELAEARRLLAAVRARLEDRAFIERAPADVVAAARARGSELEERVERLGQRLVG
jgi:valyl-tRNA synthetase